MGVGGAIKKLLWLFFLTSFLLQALSGLERMQELVGKNLNNIVGNLWQRQDQTEGSGSSHGNIVSKFWVVIAFEE